MNSKLSLPAVQLTRPQNRSIKLLRTSSQSNKLLDSVSGMSLKRSQVLPFVAVETCSPYYPIDREMALIRPSHYILGTPVRICQRSIHGGAASHAISASKRPCPRSFMVPRILTAMEILKIRWSLPPNKRSGGRAETSPQRQCTGFLLLPIEPVSQSGRSMPATGRARSADRICRGPSRRDHAALAHG